MTRSLSKRLWTEHLRPQWRTLALALVFMVALAVASAAYAVLAKLIIDRAGALEDADAAQAAWAFARFAVPVLLGVTLVSGVSMYAQRLLSNRLALNTVAGLQKRMFRAAHAGDYAQMTAEPTGTLVSRFVSDVGVVSNALIRVITNLAKDTLTVAFLLATMLWLDWQLTLLVLVVYPLALWPVIAISRRLRGRATDVQEQVGAITSELTESFRGARLVKTYGLEAREDERLSLSFDRRIALMLRVVSDQARVDPILEVVGGLAVAGLFIFGVYRVTGGASTPGDIAGILVALISAAPRVRALGTLGTVYQEGLASLSRIYDLIDRRAEVVDAPDARDLGRARGHIRLEGVGFLYPDGTAALSGIDLDIAPGETVALVGPSGGGKSTLLNLIPRLFDVSEGRLSVDGHDVRDLTLASLRGNIALVGQHVTLFSDTVAANISLGRNDASRADIEAAARAADAHDFIMALPDGYDTVLAEDGQSLSGGQRQRIAIARAILRDAPILLLDEATSALDARTQAAVTDALARLRAGRTTLMVTHRPEATEGADRVIRVEDGRIAASHARDA